MRPNQGKYPVQYSMSCVSWKHVKAHPWAVWISWVYDWTCHVISSTSEDDTQESSSRRGLSQVSRKKKKKKHVSQNISSVRLQYDRLGRIEQRNRSVKNARYHVNESDVTHDKLTYVFQSCSVVTVSLGRIEDFSTFISAHVHSTFQDTVATSGTVLCCQYLIYNIYCTTAFYNSTRNANPSTRFLQMIKLTTPPQTPSSPSVWISHIHVRTEPLLQHKLSLLRIL